MPFYPLTLQSNEPPRIHPRNDADPAVAPFKDNAQLEGKLRTAPTTLEAARAPVGNSPAHPRPRRLCRIYRECDATNGIFYAYARTRSKDERVETGCQILKREVTFWKMKLKGGR